MRDYLKINIKEILTLPTYTLTAISVAGGVVLFAPEVFINQMYMSNFRDEYGFIIGIVFLVSVSILLVNLGYWLFRLLQNKWFEKRFYVIGEKRLNNLNDYQKAIIYGLYQEDNRTAPLPLHDGAISELESHVMIGKVSSKQVVNMMNPAIYYMLQPWVIWRLDEDQELRVSCRNAFQRYDN